MENAIPLPKSSPRGEIRDLRGKPQGIHQSAAGRSELDDRWIGAVGANIQFQRKKAGLTQEKLAEAASLAPRTIQKIEAGSITILITTLKRIRAAIGCPYDLLLVGSMPAGEESKATAKAATPPRKPHAR